MSGRRAPAAERVILGALLSTIFYAGVAAQTPDPTALSLEELLATPVDHVYGVSKFLQKISDAPASVAVIAADEIELFGYRTLAEILRSVEGISVTCDRNYTYIGLRGLSRPGDLNNRVLVLVDGHRMNNNVDGQAMLGTDFQLDVGAIERVEVIRGPSASLYGSTAFSAVIAVVTRRGHDLDGGELSASFGSQGTTHARASWGRRDDRGRELFVSASRYRSDGYEALFFPEFAAGTAGGVARNADADRADAATFSASWGDLTAHGLYAERTKQVPTASFETAFAAGQEKTFDGRMAVDVQYTRELGRSTKLLARTYFDRSTYDGYYPYAVSGEASAGRLLMNRDHFHGLWWGSEVDVSNRWWRAHNVTVGAEARRDVEQSVRNYDEDPAATYIDERPQSYTLALNAQDEYNVRRGLLVNVAARVERIGTGDVEFTPKVGVILSPPAATIKVLFSRAVRPPSAYELYYDSPANAGNAALAPERTQSFEVKLERAVGRAMTVGGSLYANAYSDLIVDAADQDGRVTLENALDVHAHGADVAWTVKAASGLRARASYATLFDSDDASNAWTGGAPKHLLKLNAGGPIAPLGVSIGAAVFYESERRTHAGEVLGSAWVAQINVLRRNLLPGLDLTAAVFNLLGARYREPVSENHLQGAIEQDGRQFLVGVTWRLK